MTVAVRGLLYVHAFTYCVLTVIARELRHASVWHMTLIDKRLGDVHTFTYDRHPVAVLRSRLRLKITYLEDLCIILYITGERRCNLCAFHVSFHINFLISSRNSIKLTASICLNYIFFSVFTGAPETEKKDERERTRKDERHGIWASPEKLRWPHRCDMVSLP